jgi:hypothetical protein
MSRWAIAGVVVLIAATSGVTMLGLRTAPVSAAAASTGILEIGRTRTACRCSSTARNAASRRSPSRSSAGAHVVELVNGAERRKVP